MVVHLKVAEAMCLTCSAQDASEAHVWHHVGLFSTLYSFPIGFSSPFKWRTSHRLVCRTPHPIPEHDPYYPALFSFTEGPPFTLQRLCEILLNARVIYPNLSKLALALEKNLLVTSILTRSTDPYPSSTVQLPDAPDDHTQETLPPSTPPSPTPLPPRSIPIENGREPIVGDRDEVMSEEDAQADDGMTIDMESFEEIISSDSNPEPTNNS